jgi:HEAT repeat protein
VVGVLWAALQDDAERYHPVDAIRALEELRDPIAMPLFQECLNDRQLEVQVAAARVLIRLAVFMGD